MTTSGFNLSVINPLTHIAAVVWQSGVRGRVSAIGFCVAVACCFITGQSSADETKSLKAMLVTGGCCHDYDAQRVIVTEGLSQRLGQIEWTIHQYAEPKDTRATVYDDPDWAKGFDLIVHNECFGGMQDSDLIQRIIDGHRKYKVPAVFIHCSMHSYRTSTAAESWREFLGVTSTFHEGAKRPLTIVPTAIGKESPLIKSIGESWETPNGELYIIKKVWPGTEVLAQAYSTEQKADQPVIWTRNEQGVRVFGTTLGHHNETMRSEQWQEFVAAGTKWALGRE